MNEIDEVRRIQLGVLAEIEQLREHPGSYRYICYAAGGLLLAHHPVGRVIAHLSSKGLLCQ